MKIISYRDLKSKDGLLPLLDHAFGWVFNQSRFEDFVKVDPRLRNGPVSFCAEEGGRIIGHVGVMEMTSRTLDRSMEHMGGLYGVATLPSYARKGVCTTLMKKAHEYFRSKGYRFSFLFTGRALVAHALYRKLGYVDAVDYPSVYKILHDKRAGHSRRESSTGFDPERILEIYSEFSKDKTGFVVRDKPYLKMLKKHQGIRPRQCIVDKEGYVIFRQDESGVWVKELVSLNEEQTHKLIDILENRTKGCVYDRTVLDTNLLEAYRSRGYMVQNRSWGVMMSKPLVSSACFKKTYGDRFHLSHLDVF